MADEALGREFRARLEELLGEPLMVDDPLITTAQAAVLLGVSSIRVARLVRAGHLPAVARTHRRVRLSDVIQVGHDQWMSVGEAADLLTMGRAGVGRMITAGLLPARGTELPLRRNDVEILARLREGWLTLSAAASALDVDIEEIRRMLRSRVLTHTRDGARPVHGHEVARQLIMRSGALSEPTPASRGSAP